MARRPSALLALLSSIPAPAAAQVGVEWAEEAGSSASRSGPRRALALEGTLAVACAVDDNVFLTEAAKEAQPLVAPRGQLRLSYDTPRLELRADAMVNFNWYPGLIGSSSDEERALLRLSYSFGDVVVSATDVLRRESDPVDVEYSGRIRRVVNNLQPVITFRSFPFHAESFLDFGVVAFELDELGASRDNLNLRGGLLLGINLRRRFELVVDGGVLAASFGDRGPADPIGWFAHAGFQGNVEPRLAVSLRAGASGARAGGAIDPFEVQLADVDVSAKLRFNATSRLILRADYTRRLGFGGGRSSFQTINQGIVGAHWTVLPGLQLRLRAQADLLTAPRDPSRAFVSAGGTVVYRFTSEHLLFEAGPVYRKSIVDSGPGSYDAFLMWAGLAAKLDA
ncbi:MAG: hypothetical protein HYV07_01765 [Deltaproteobacteria bacterium]|nr:hypothetical protein [Deltaproteobacteria bacterium]